MTRHAKKQYAYADCFVVVEKRAVISSPARDFPLTDVHRCAAPGRNDATGRTDEH